MVSRMVRCTYRSSKEAPLTRFQPAAKDVKPHMNIVFIGHVDAGKSTMGGNILYLCGMVDKRTLEKYEREAKEAGRESWYLSWALDSTSQEREKVRPLIVACGANALTLCDMRRARPSRLAAPTSRPTSDGTRSSMPQATRTLFRP